MAKAVLLLSGGLDSTLAGKMLLDMGVELDAINFTSTFCSCAPGGPGSSAAEISAEQLGIDVDILALGEEYLDMIKKAAHGRGSGVNPCIDCRIFVFNRAKERMERTGADFIATGEVVGERPMSQLRGTIELIERTAELQGRVVRPLSAKLLPPSIPETEGLIDREQMLDISGRSRKPQIQLAEKLGITSYPTPAGGCILTEDEYAARFRDLFDRDPDFDMNDAELLRWGRHFRLPSGAKLVVGRKEEENSAIERLAREGDVALLPLVFSGPTVLCRGELTMDDVRTAAAILAGYSSKAGDAPRVELKAKTGDWPEVIEGFEAIAPDDAARWRINARIRSKGKGKG